MTFTDAIRTCFRKYATFSGRASRPEYWWFFLFIVLGNVAAGILDGVFFGAADIEVSQGDGGFRASAQNNGPIGLVFGLATLLPALAAGWRRMHDTGRSGLYLLYPLIVMVGIMLFQGFAVSLGMLAPGGGGEATLTGIAGIVLIFATIILVISPLLVLWWLSRPSQPGPNEYGPAPAGGVPA